jgi:prevent-host-death family protein
MNRVSATDAARHFSDLVNRVAYRGEEFVVERAGAPVCRIVPVAPTRCTVEELSHHLETLPLFDDEYRTVVRHLGRRQRKMPRPPW